MLGNEADAVDAAQDALLSAVRAISRFDGRSSFGTWLYRIATNACLDELRRRRRRPLVGLPGDADHDGAGRRAAPAAAFGPGGDGGRFQPAFGAGTRDPADEAIAHVDVDAALRSLAPEHRVALVLRDVVRPDLRGDRLILDVPIGTVRSRIARGRAALADLPPEPAPDDPPTGESGPLPEDRTAGTQPGGPVVKPGKRTERPRHHDP